MYTTHSVCCCTDFHITKLYRSRVEYRVGCPVATPSRRPSSLRAGRTPRARASSAHMVLRDVPIDGYGVVYVSTSRARTVFAAPKPPRHVVCAACADILRKPRRAPCGHAFCAECANDATQRSGTCPACKAVVNDDDWIPDESLSLEIGNLPTHCAYAWRRESGDESARMVLDYRGFGARTCGAIVRFADLERHCAECAYRVVICGLISRDGGTPTADERCGYECRATTLEEHRKTCEYAVQPCVNVGCSWTGSMKFVRRHVEHECAFVPVKCAYGCGTTTRDAASAARHEETCPVKEVPCGAIDDEDTDENTRCCPVVMKRNALAHHRESVCDYARTSTCADCKKIVAARSAIRHAQTCQKIRLLCPAGCGAEVTKETERRHLDIDCPAVEIQCEFHEVGCLFRGPRGTMSRHEETETQAHFALVLKASVEVRDVSMRMAESCKSIVKDENGFTSSEREEVDVVLKAMRDEEIRALEGIKALREDEAEARNRGLVYIDALKAAVADQEDTYNVAIANINEDIAQLREEFEAFKRQNALELAALRETVESTQLAVKDVSVRVSTLNRGGGVIEELQNTFLNDIEDERVVIMGEIEKQSRKLRFELEDLKTEQNKTISRIRDDIRAVLKR